MKVPALASKKIKIVLANTFKLERECLAVALASRSNFKLVAQAETGDELLALLENVNPNIIVAKLDQLCKNPVELLLEIKKKFPGIKIIILSPPNHPIFKTEYLFRRFTTFFTQNCGIEDLILAISEVYKKGDSNKAAKFSKITQKISDILIYKFLKRENDIIDCQLMLNY